MDQIKRWQIFWLAAVGVGGTAFALGIQLCLSIISGYGWWKVGMAAFVFLCLLYVLWRSLRQALAENTKNV
jgi:bacteriorhodopsin